MAELTVPDACDLLLTGGSVLTVDDERQVFEPGAVAIADRRIAAVGPAGELARILASRTVDCAGCALIPGFADCDDRLLGSLVRGLEDGLAGDEPGALTRRVAGTVTREEVLAAARLGALEAALGGITAIAVDDDEAIGSALADGIEGLGLRAVAVAPWSGGGERVVYHPVADQAQGRGALPLRSLRDAGVVVGLGHGDADGRRDMFEAMKQAILLQRVDTLDPTISWAEEALELATREGARFLGTEAGWLAPGRLADVVVVRMGAAHTTPWHRAVATLVYSARPSDVRMTIVGGEVVVEGGRSTVVDGAAVIADARRAAEAIVARCGLDVLSVPWRRWIA